MSRPISQPITEYQIPWTREPSPIDWTATFARSGPLVVEIGFGNGEFLADQARAHPERNYVGIEVSWGSLTRLFRRLDKERTRNVRALQGDAEVLLALGFAPGTVDQVIINHPCPWPKDRHQERRLIQPRFLSLLADRMASGARLSVRTDHDAYAGEIGQVLAGERALAPAQEPPEAERLRRVVTKYQRQAMEQGIGIHYFEYVRTEGPSNLPPIPEALPHASMPSLLLHGSYPQDALFEGLGRDAYRETKEGVEIVVRFLSTFRHTQRTAWLVETLVKEDKLRQEFGILIVPRGDGLLVKLGIGDPKPTWGVKRAVEQVGSWLARQHGLEIVEDTLGALGHADE